ncbi:MAG: matrixin family metalloprotease [Kofleriaceae bacterium]
MPRWWYASLLALALSACGAEPDTTIDITFDPCEPIAVAMPADELRAAGVRAAFASWGMEPSATGAQGAEIRLVFEDAAEAFHGLYDDENAVIYINAKITDPVPLAIVIAHELGHAMGLPHIDEPSVMRSGNVTIAPTADDEARIAALWGACERERP